MRVRSVEERLWRRVTRDGADGCWEWQGARSPKGYGRIQTGTLAVSRTRLVHRVAWDLTHGPVPTGMCVLHRCDNPPCCNPAHLFLGTIADNNRDKVLKGRQPSGATHQSAILRDGEIEAIRSLALAGWVQQDIADAFGVSQQHVSLVKGGLRRSSHLRGETQCV